MKVLILVILLNTEANCLALNIYKEARGEPIYGQTEVALVTKNRVNDPRWPNTYCKVVKQEKQFSWYTNQESVKVKDNKQWKIAKDIAHSVIMHSYIPNMGSLYFVNPSKTTKVSWLKGLKFNKIIGNHYFYTDKN